MRLMQFRDAFPIVYAEDIERSVAFYGAAFGFQPRFRWPRRAYSRLPGTNGSVTSQTRTATRST